MLFAALALLCNTAAAQTIFWSDNFDAPAGGANNNNNGVGWTLNSGGNGGNTWFINTPTTSFGCSSSGNALHISCSGGFCSFFGGPNELVYLAGSSNDRSAVSPDINTAGQSNISLSFDFKCEGIANQDYGTLSFSSDGGTTWDEQPGRFQSVTSCSTYTVSIPAQYSNIPNFRIRFRWIESNASQGQDPAFGVDNIRLSASSAACTPPTVNAGTAASICAGAQTTIGGSPTATGGSPSNYTYSWAPATGLSSTTVANPVASPTATTTYTVTVSGGDANCTATSQVTVTVNTPAALTTTPAGNQSICAGQSLSLSAAAGFTNYVWTTPTGSQNGQSINATAAGNYSVTATSNGCSATSAPVVVTVTNSQTLNVTADGPLSLCQGQDVVLTADPGFSNYTWSNGQSGQSITVTTAGSYTVSAQGTGGCDAVSSAQVVTISPPFSVAITPSGTVTLCQGQSATLTAQAGFSNYVWSNNSTGQTLEVTSAGGYSVSAQNASGCTGTSQIVFVEVSPAPMAMFSYEQLDEDEYNVQFTYTGSAVNSYFWDFGNGTSTEQNPIHAFGFDAQWPVTLIVTNDCGSDTITRPVDVIKTSIAGIPGLNMQLYPNPASTQLSLSGTALNAETVQLSLYSVTGKLLMRYPMVLNASFNHPIDISGLSAGMYVIRLENDKGSSTLRWSKTR